MYCIDHISNEMVCMTSDSNEIGHNNADQNDNLKSNDKEDLNNE